MPQAGLGGHLDSAPLIIDISYWDCFRYTWRQCVRVPTTSCGRAPIELAGLTVGIRGEPAPLEYRSGQWARSSRVPALSSLFDVYAGPFVV